ncbi:MAG TPA: glycosyltransferase [Vicinamibacteria bacterium]|nr:glycosyltransferase [Vicinamibacteria bacterium]
MPRVALVHDWLTGMRGGEKVLLSLLRLYPDAPIHTLLHVKGSVAPEIEARPIHTTFVQRLPGVARRYRHYLPLFPTAAESMDLAGYDLLISTSHCVVKGVRARPGARHLCYCFTPMRYVWDRYADYFGPGRAGLVTRLVMGAVAPRLRRWDRASSARVDRFAADSAYVAARIRRHYDRDSEVIYPPVDTEFFTPGPEAPGTYDLVVSALAPYKRIDLVLDAYRGCGWPLRVAGSGPEEPRLRAMAPPEAVFLGHVGDEALRELYRGARAVLMPGIEDFGIVPVEAMACGRPVVVYAEGGGTETVVEGETGLYFREASPAALRRVVDSLKTLRFNTRALRDRAEAFSRAVFESRFKAFVEKALAESPNPC